MYFPVPYNVVEYTVNAWWLTESISLNNCPYCLIIEPPSPCSYVHEASDGIEAETEFIYDLELPADFRPYPLDGEVSEYHLWDMEKVNSVFPFMKCQYSYNQYVAL